MYDRRARSVGTWAVGRIEEARVGSISTK